MNCWIDEHGTARPVSPGRHAIDKRPGDAIRVSWPERRRTFAGIEVDADAPPLAIGAALRMVRTLRKEGFDIYASVGGKVIECMASDRPTELNRQLNASKGG